MTILDRDVAAASTSLIVAHKRVVKEKNQMINKLQAEKGELQRALQEKAAEVTRAKYQAKRALEDAIYERERADAVEIEATEAPVTELDQRTIGALNELGNALDSLSRDWPSYFDLALGVRLSGSIAIRWHQEDGITEWQFNN